jgi:hypothetical protein
MLFFKKIEIFLPVFSLLLKSKHNNLGMSVFVNFVFIGLILN